MNRRPSPTAPENPPQGDRGGDESFNAWEPSAGNYPDNSFSVLHGGIGPNTFAYINPTFGGTADESFSGYHGPLLVGDYSKKMDGSSDVVLPSGHFSADVYNKLPGKLAATQAELDLNTKIVKDSKIKQQAISNELNTMKANFSQTMKANEEEIKGLASDTQKLKNDISEMKNDISKTREANEEAIERSTIKSVEILGVLASVLALVLVFTGVADAAIAEKGSIFRNAFLILLLGTSSLILFVALIHAIINRKHNPAVWALVVVPLVIYFFVGMILFSDAIQMMFVGSPAETDSMPANAKKSTSDSRLTIEMPNIQPD